MEADTKSDARKNTDPGDWTRARTALALDRTLLAWIRTALTLIGFGFTLAKFVHDMIARGVIHGAPPLYPRQIGFVLMGLGVATLVGGAFEYVRLGRKLGIAGIMSSVSLLVTGCLVMLGVFLIASLLVELKSL